MSIGRIKVMCGENVVQDGVGTHRISFSAVQESTEGGTNDDFFSGTPGGSISLVGVKPEVAEKFERGSLYHVDFVNVR